MENWKRYLAEQQAKATPEQLMAAAAMAATAGRTAIKGKQGQQLPTTIKRTGTLEDDKQIVSPRNNVNRMIEAIGIILGIARGQGTTVKEWQKDQGVGQYVAAINRAAAKIADRTLKRYAPIGAKLEYRQDAFVDNKLKMSQQLTSQGEKSQMSDDSVQTYVEYILGLGDVQVGQFAGIKDKAVTQQQKAVAQQQKAQPAQQPAVS